MKRESLAYEILIGGLSVVFVFVSTATLLPIDPNIKSFFGYAEWLGCAVFFADFVRNLWVAPDRKRYMLTWGWLDLLSSAPALGPLRVLRIIRTFRSVLRVMDNLKDQRQDVAVVGAGVLALIVSVVSGALILQLEHGADGANIQTAEDAIWWAFVTITTVGYGDRFPVTSLGRVVAGALMLSGILLVAIVTARIASWFMERQS